MSALQNTVIVINTVCQLFLIMFIGYYFAKKKVFNTETNKTLSFLVCTIALPALVLSSVQGIESPGGIKTVMSYLGAGILFYGVSIPVAFLLCKLMHFPKNEMSAYQIMLIFSNCSFMGYPVMSAFLGDYSVFVGSIFNMPFNVLIYSYGIYLLTKNGDQKQSFQPKNLINAGSVSSILAILIYVFQIPLPSTLSSCMKTLGSITTPVSMIVLGVSLAQIPLKKTLSNKNAYKMCFCRLIILPIFTWLYMHYLITDSTLLGVAIGTAAMPVASMCVMLNTLYGDNGDNTAIGVCLSTLCSIITIPLIIVLLF